MKLRTLVLSTFVLTAASFGARAALQEGMPMAKPGPEHEVLKHMTGNWDAEVQVGPTKDKGTTTSKSLNGLWVLGDFQGSMMGMPFTGHSVTGWDSTKKKYVSTWVDSVSTEMSIMEGTWDAATKTMTLSGEGTDPMTGQKTAVYGVTKVTDADHHVWEMRMGKLDSPPMMTITYTRKK